MECAVGVSRLPRRRKRHLASRLSKLLSVPHIATGDLVCDELSSNDPLSSQRKKVGGEIDWYGILGGNPNDGDETIRRHYRKLALLLHPDKHKSVGADGAFKLLSEAWSLLSDKAKRSAYNQRRSMRAFQQKAPPPSAPFQQYVTN